jgi:hypothetical protein
MKRGRLLVVPVPWMVSPSVPELRIKTIENAGTQVALDVLALDGAGDDSSELISRGVEVGFGHGQWVRTYPAASDRDPIPGDLFDRGSLGTGADLGDPDAWLRRFRVQWRDQGNCPDPGFYEVAESAWISEVNAARFGCQHFVLAGHDLWMEVLCMGFTWRWTEPGSLGIETANWPSRR